MLEGEGSMDMNIGSGSFLEAPAGAAGALRVVSILNLADIVRRLSLTHMFESGIPFDSVEGEVLLDRGTIDVERMEVKGGSSFAFSGVSEVGTQSLDGELIATLPVAKNLPWVAALAASLPIAAGVYVVSKVFKTQMNRLSSAVYSIGGTWNDPLVEFDHIYDGSAIKDTNATVNKAADNAANTVPDSTSNNAAGGNTGNTAAAAAENPALEDKTLIAPDPQSMPQSVPEPVSP